MPKKKSEMPQTLAISFPVTSHSEFQFSFNLAEIILQRLKTQKKSISVVSLPHTISSSLLLTVFLSSLADSPSLLKAIQQCLAHWSERVLVQCGGKCLSQGMIDLNSSMVAPKATQPPLIVMDARMWPIMFLSMGKSLLPCERSPGTFTWKRRFVNV